MYTYFRRINLHLSENNCFIWNMWSSGQTAHDIPPYFWIELFFMWDIPYSYFTNMYLFAINPFYSHAYKLFSAISCCRWIWMHVLWRLSVHIRPLGQCKRRIRLIVWVSRKQEKNFQVPFSFACPTESPFDRQINRVANQSAASHGS